MIRSLSANRALLLLIVLCLLVLALGRWLLPPGLALNAVISLGYWWTLAAVILAGVSFWRLFQQCAVVNRPTGLTVVVILAVSACWHAQERFGFKVLSDEIVMLGTSQNMHLGRDVGYGIRATDVRGPFELLQCVLDKRPLLYPFLVSVLHDWTGYRPANAFWLNAGIGVGFLVLLHGLGAKIGRHRSAGHVAVLIAGGIPLLAQQASGGGFELLNLTLLTAWLWQGITYLEDVDGVRQDAFVLTAVLLACTRYESLLYLVPTALLVGFAWRRSRTILITPATVLAPVLLLPSLWLHATFDVDAGRWEMASKGADSVFSLSYVPDNLGHAAAHFLATDGYQPNSLVFGVLGLLALPLFLLWSLRVWRAPRQAAPADLALAWSCLGLWGGSALLMLYFWGQFDHPVIHRLSLPTQLLMLVALLVVLGRMVPYRQWLWKAAALVAIATLLGWSLPVMAKNAYGHTYTPGLAYAWREQFLHQIAERQVLVIDRDTQFWITQKIAATPVAQAEVRKEGIAFHLRNRSFADIFVFQCFKYDEATGIEAVYPEDSLSPAFELTPVAQLRLTIGHMARISRVTAIREGDKVVAQPTWPTPTRPAVNLPAEQTEAARRAYMDNWIKQLP
ncbi:MAG: hypothetical protein H2172_15645 [Opitutus sp.]|nr:hypothetical protein [Opitutus sp.]MCS6246069.1 hypothetical protein [Opitutus sp.]MCS6273715.1 hypothetical protein [Opitutus sp.]MCS6276204.1 hypothetical protein [Opitutus sp.]MCS6301298.1 hypothetical protein [Opitutus sp.]